MPADYFHGSRTVEFNDGIRYIRTVESSTVGMVVVADDADNTIFPLNEIAGFSGYDPSLIGKAGDTGTLAQCLDAIYDQGYAPLTAIVRVAHADDPVEQQANVVAGFDKLRLAQARFGWTPRILGAPGLDKNLAVANQAIVLADRLKAFAYLPAVGNTAADVVTYRNHFGSKRAMLIWPDFGTAADPMLATARALGMRAKIDNEIGWHRVISNIPVNGVWGISHDVDWSLQAEDTTAIYLNSKEVTTLIQREGYRFWGSRTCSTDTMYAFESYVRTGDILGYSFADAMFHEIDGAVTRGKIDYILDSINQKYLQLTNEGYILGGRCWIEERDNPSASVMNGRLVIRRDFTPCPPLEDLLQKQIITDKYVINLFA